MTRQQAWERYAAANGIQVVGPDYQSERRTFFAGWDAREGALSNAHPPDSVIWTADEHRLVDHKTHETSVNEARGTWHAKCACGWVDRHDYEHEESADRVAADHLAHVRRLGQVQADAYRGIVFGGVEFDRALGEGRR